MSPTLVNFLSHHFRKKNFLTVLINIIFLHSFEKKNAYKTLIINVFIIFVHLKLRCSFISKIGLLLQIAGQFHAHKYPRCEKRHNNK